MTYGRICAVGLIMIAGSSSSVSSQTVLSGCDAATGLGSNGLPCVELAPIDPNRISSVSFDADGSDQFRTLDVTTLGQTYACREVDVNAGGNWQGSLLIEDCGAPLTGAELGQLQPFYGTTGSPPPLNVASLPPAPPPSVAPTLPSVPVISAPIPSSLPPVNQIASATLAADTATGFVPLIAAAAPFIAGAVGVAGIAAAAAAAGGSSASSTN